MQDGYHARVKLSQDEQRLFTEAVESARLRDDVHRAVHNLYGVLQDAIDLRNPVCVQSGRCCHFDEFGHRLFVTTMEMVTFLHELKHQQCNLSDTPGGGCPFQQNKLCQVHLIRPLGCRIFFCDESAIGWQRDQYANFHQELKRLHDQLKIPYFYVEWREALAAVQIDHVISSH